MALFIISNILFGIFFVYAISVCRKKQKAAQQPATLALYVFIGLLADLVLSFLITRVGMLPFLFPVLKVIHVPLQLALLFCVFGWRNTGEATYKRPAILAAIAVALKLSVIFLNSVGIRMIFENNYQGSTQSLYTMVGTLISVMNMLAYVFIFTAIFDSRGYVQAKPDPVIAAIGLKQEASVAAPAVPATGIFEEKDFIPYVCGVMILGGVVVVPVMWGGLSHLDYGESLFPALLSCGIFAASHDKRGNFLFGRFLMIMAFTFMIIMRSALQYGGGKPIFLAGGILGFLVMFGCGWAGIMVGRLIRGKPAA